MNKSSLKLFFLIICLLLPSQVFAFSGYVTGYLKSYNDLGQYCPSDGSRSCNGAIYTELDANRFQPLREMKVQIYSGSQLVGVGTTDAVGKYLIQYTSSGVPSSLKVLVRLEHKDSRFRVYAGNGNSQNLIKTTNIVLWNTTASNPQNIGTTYWGNASVPIKGFNIYEAAWRTWRFGFRYSAPLGWHFNNVKLLNGNGSISQATGKTISIQSGDQFEYHTIAHEMGHVGSSSATNGGQFYFSGAYCYPSQALASNCGHSLNSQEWGSVQFEEGLATFMGLVGAFDPSAHDPIYCVGRGSQHCLLPSSSINSVDLETSLGSNCTTADRRREINTAKYLRDLYDNSTGDGMQVSFPLMMVGIYRFSNGVFTSRGNRGKNEPWNYYLTGLDDHDGRSTRDYRAHVEAAANVNSASVYNLNCNPVGD